MTRVDVPTVDEMCELLSHSRSRLVLQYFDQHSNPVKLEDIAPTIARWEAPEGTSPSEEEIQLVRDTLDESLFPRLTELGLATYDPDGEIVRYDADGISAAIANVETVLEFLWSAERSATTDIEEASDVSSDTRSAGGE